MAERSVRKAAIKPLTHIGEVRIRPNANTPAHPQMKIGCASGMVILLATLPRKSAREARVSHASGTLFLGINYSRLLRYKNRNYKISAAYRASL